MAKILLVEDNEMNQDMLRRRLERRGFEVLSAFNGTDALEMAGQALPDLVLMDISLPDLDGWEATRRLKADVATQAIPIVVLTAYALTEDRERSLAAGAVDFDTKPIDFARLLGKIEAVLQHAASKAEA